MATTAADRLASDPRLAQARELLLQAVFDHTKSLSVCPAEPDAVSPYLERLRQFGAMRGAPLYYDYLGSGLGRGPFVELADGSVKLDLICGIGVHVLGHNHPRIVATQIEAALRNTTMQGNLIQNVESHEFMKLLLGAARRRGALLEHCTLSTSGAMANENALKICFQKHFPARRLLAFEKGFAGRTMTLSQVTDKAAFREGLPPSVAVDYIPFFAAEVPGSTETTLSVLRQHLARHPNDHAGMILELVQGERGFNTAPPEFFRALLSELRGNGLGIIIDEIQTFGRNSEPFVFQLLGLDDLVDIVTVGKCTQVCATLYSAEYRPRAGLISQTFTGATAAIMAGGAVLSELLDGGYYGASGKIARLRRDFEAGFHDLMAAHPNRLLGPYGIGSMIAFQVDDGSAEGARQFAQSLFDLGLIAFTAGSSPTRMRFLLPVGAVETEHLNLAIKIIGQALAASAEKA